MLTALVTRYKIKNPIELGLAAVLTFIANSFITNWLGLGLQIDYNQALASLGFVVSPNGMTQTISPYALVFLFPFAILWEYFQLYGVAGFIMSTATGIIAGRILGGRKHQ